MIVLVFPLFLFDFSLRAITIDLTIEWGLYDFWHGFSNCLEKCGYGNA